MAILINDTTPRIQYTATSGQTVFTVPFEFFENADLKVYKNSTLLTITTNYTVTGAGVTGGGSVTLTSGATAGDVITIFRDIAVKRVTDFPTSGPFNISALNNDLDRIVAMVQEREDEVTRVIQLSDTDPAVNLQMPAAASRASRVLGFDATGNVISMQELGNYRGNWASGTAYVLRDLIKDTTNANIYICVAAHTSSGSLPISTNANAAAWALLVDAATATSSSSAAASSASAAASSASAASSSASAAAGSASAASTSASNAATSASNAATSATNASNSASTASTQATNAASSASSASTSATNAANSATSASGSASTATTQASNASSSATSAASSASTATTQASNAASSASAASTSASNAATSASNASSSATAAAAAQSAAETARDQTLTAFDNFDDRYLGTKTGDPALDNDGNALVAGALYFDSTSGVMKVYTGSAWVAAYVSGSGFLATSGGTITGNLVVNSNSASDGVRITQTGAGNALVVEDSASPDSSPFVVDATGLLVTGAATNQAANLATGNARVQILGGTAPLALFRDADSSTPINLEFAKRRATGGLLASGDTIGRLYFSGNDGVAAIPAAFIEAAVDTTPGLNDMPGRLVFSTTADGASSPTERMRITNAGNVGIGTSSPNSLLELNKASGASDIRLSVAGTLYGTAYASSSDMTINSVTAIPLKLGTNNTERFQIGSSGQLGIGGANYGTSGQVLTSNGSAAAPSWQAAAGFPSGTAMMFVQTAAPTGWTKSTTHDNKALRVVSGAASSGGSVAFTTAFASQTPAGTVGNTTLSTSQIPSHTHTYDGPVGGGCSYDGGGSSFGNRTSGATGGGGSHNHSLTMDPHTHSFTGTAINLAVKYVDVIFASKD
jgi:hypothetical protein